MATKKKNIIYQCKVPIENVVTDTSSESISKRRDRSSELAKPSHRRVVCFSSTLPLQFLHLQSTSSEMSFYRDYKFSPSLERLLIIENKIKKVMKSIIFILHRHFSHISPEVVIKRFS